MMRAGRLSRWGVLALLLALGCGQAGVAGDAKPKPAAPAPEAASFPPPPAGSRKLVAVLPFGLSRRAGKLYPELRKKTVGFGVHNMIVDTLADTRWFRFVEINPEVMEQLMKQLWTSTSDLVDPAHALKLGMLRQPTAIIYGQVFEFGVSRREELVGVKSIEKFETRIGIQIRIVDPSTAEYTPASGAGAYLSGARERIAGINVRSFKESGVGEASRRAIRRAVIKLLRRMP